MKRIYSLFVLLLFVAIASPLSAADATNWSEKGWIEPFLFKLEPSTSAEWGGTAVMFDFEERADSYYAYLLTNAHTIPASATSVFVSGMLSKQQPFRASVIGTSPGYDIGVVMVELSKSSIQRNAELFKALTGFYKTPKNLPTPSQPEKPLPLEVLGFEWTSFEVPEVREQRAPLWVSHGWEDEATLIKTQDRAAYNRISASPAKIPLEITTRCPQPFLQSCYVFPMRTWGFSGSPLIIDENGKGRIIGLISHYSPLTPFSYAIPIDTAAKEARRIISAWKMGGEHVLGASLTDTPDGWARINSKGDITLLKGPLAGSVIQPMGTTSETQGGGNSGGGDSTGGGGNSGGGDPTGGGGHSKVTPSGASDVVPLPFAFDILTFIQELNRPQGWCDNPQSLPSRILESHWHFKGIQALFRYRKGVVLKSGDNASVVYQLDGNNVTNPREFLMHYMTKAADPNYKPVTNGTFPKLSLQHHLHSSSPGLYTSTVFVYNSRQIYQRQTTGFLMGATVDMKKIKDGWSFYLHMDGGPRNDWEENFTIKGDFVQTEPYLLRWNGSAEIANIFGIKENHAMSITLERAPDDPNAYSIKILRFKRGGPVNAGDIVPEGIYAEMETTR